MYEWCDAVALRAQLPPNCRCLRFLRTTTHSLCLLPFLLTPPDTSAPRSRGVCIRAALVLSKHPSRAAWASASTCRASHIRRPCSRRSPTGKSVARPSATQDHSGRVESPSACVKPPSRLKNCVANVVSTIRFSLRPTAVKATTLKRGTNWILSANTLSKLFEKNGNTGTDD